MVTASSSNRLAESDRRLRLPSERRVRGPATEATERELAAVRRTTWMIVLAWTILSIGSFAWDATQMRETTWRLAHTEADTHINKETALRNWIAGHGGVYVAPDERTPPNPYQANAPDQTAVTGGGKPLTLISTAYLTRLLQESYTELYGTRGRISSAQPLNPANLPSAWEQKAYTAFAAGAVEYASVVDDGGKPYYGFARVLKATAACLKCHTEKGLQVGDTLGAISLLVDLAPYRQIERDELRSGAVTHGGIWLVGLLGILAAVRVGTDYLRERQDTQHAQMESQYLFQTMADYSSDWIFWRNPDGLFRYVSPACEHISGYAPQAFYADPDLFLNVVHPQDRESFRQHIEQANQGQSLSPQELRIVARDGTLRFLSHTCRPIHDSEGRFIGVRGANHDITRLRENEQMLINQSRHAAMGEMINNIAHQWRQPISAVGLILQNLEYDYAERRLKPEGLHDYVARGRELIAKMSTTIDDFRNFFRPEYVPVVFDIRDSIRDAIAIIHDSFRAHGIEILWSDEGAHRVSGYPNELAQMLLNLLANAKDAILDRHISPGVVDIRVGTVADGIVVTMRDNGGGIPAEVLPRIFDPYFTTKDNGTGIGLYMSSTIIGHMGGTLVARNVDGGAEFRLQLPVAPAAEGASA